jgi:hypothetical protein
MFDLIMLGLVLAGVVAISRAPAPKQEAETPQRPAPDVWTPQTDWRRFHKPTYLRRGVVPGSGQARSTRTLPDDFCGEAEEERSCANQSAKISWDKDPFPLIPLHRKGTGSLMSLTEHG